MTDRSLYLGEMVAREDDLHLNPLFASVILGSVAASEMFGRVGDFRVGLKGWYLKLEKSSKSYTASGEAKKEECATVFSITAQVMSSFGVKIGNDDLIGMKSFTYSRLHKETVEAQLIDNAYLIGLIGLHATGLEDYDIDAAYKANLITLNTDLEAKTKLPLAVIQQHANDKIQLESLEKDVMKFFDEEMDRFMKIYRITNVGLFLAYTAARHVRHHHLKRKMVPVEPTTGTMELFVVGKSDLAAMVGVAWTVKSLGLTMQTDADGEIFKDGLAPGLYHGKLSKEGFKDVVFDFTIVAGKTCALQFLMEVVDSEEDVPPVS